METYFHEVLQKDADFDNLMENIQEISRYSSPMAIASLFELIVAAAVTCDNKAEFVSRIMEMSEQGQLSMKEIIERSLARLREYEHDDADSDYLNRDSEDESIKFGDTDSVDSYDFAMNMNNVNLIGLNGSGAATPSYGDRASITSPVPHNIHDLSSLDDHFSSYKTPGATTADHLSVFSPSDLMRERDELKRELQEAKREAERAKESQREAELVQEESEVELKKLRTLADDLQERLGKQQEELTLAEESNTKLKRQLEDSLHANTDLKSQNAAMADEMDLANAKIAQLRKAEATVIAYRKKLDNAGVISQQMAELEDQAADYYRQNLVLEKEAKKVPVLQKEIEAIQTEVNKLENQLLSKEELITIKNDEIMKMKDELKDSDNQNKRLESELLDLRQERANDNDVDMSNEGESGLTEKINSLTSAQSIKDSREKILRLEMENKRLTEQVSELTKEVQLQSSNPSSGGEQTSDESDTSLLKAKINNLKEELKTKEAEKEKLSSEKEKLESYTKKTLAKFQEKYLVALQECKAKLKEKHEKIEQMESRGQAEKNAQKREERLLSSTVYELGLAIMQQKLKERQK